MKIKYLLSKLFFIFIIPILISLLVFSNMYKKSRKVEYSDRDYSYLTYSDKETGGNSIIELKSSEQNSVDIVYTLGEDYAFPNVSFSIYNNDYRLLDFSGYDFITINIESNKAKFILLQFNIFIDGYSKKGSYETYLPIGYYLELNRSDNIYKIPLKLFKPHTWWLSTYQVSEDIIKNFSFSTVLSMEVMNDPSFPTGVEDKITFRSVFFRTDKKIMIFTIIAILCVYYLIYFSFIFIKIRLEKIKQNREKIILVPYQTTELQKGDSVESVIENYICSNYNDPGLNIAKVVDATNYSERQISKVLKNKYDYSFPGFINFLRITEAKKLLETSNSKVLDIAMQVGYNSLGHFNRTFKNIEKLTPREYKKALKIH